METTPPFVYVIRQQKEVNINVIPEQEMIELSPACYPLIRCYRTKADAEARMRSFVPAGSVATDPAVYGGYSVRRCEFDDLRHALTD